MDALDGNILYINVMNRLSVDCDCDGSPAEPDMHDIGILASYDPVALDQACVDLVYARRRRPVPGAAASNPATAYTPWNTPSPSAWAAGPMNW